MEKEKDYIKVYNKEIFLNSLVLVGTIAVASVSVTSIAIHAANGTLDNGVLSLYAMTGLVSAGIGIGTLDKVKTLRKCKKEYKQDHKNKRR